MVVHLVNLVLTILVILVNVVHLVHFTNLILITLDNFTIQKTRKYSIEDKIFIKI